MSTEGLKSRLIVIDILPGKPGTANWAFLSNRHGMAGYTVPDGAITDFTEINPRTLQFEKLTPGRETPDRITTAITVKERVKTYVERNLRNCEFQVRARDVCTSPGDMISFEKMKTLVQVLRESLEYGDPQASLIAEEQERILTMNISAGFHEITRKVNARQIALGFDVAGVDDVNINHIIYCSPPGCAECGCDGEDSDGCDKAFAVTSADTSPYGGPYLYIMDDGVWDWRDIDGAATDAYQVVCAGNKVIVSIPGDTSVFYASSDDSYEAWTEVTGFGHAPRGLHAVDGATIWAACAGGAIYRSIDGGLSYTELLDGGVLTSEDLNAVAFTDDGELGYFVGDNGAIILYEDEGFSLLTDPSGGADLLDVKIPPTRECEVYISTDDGKIWKSKNQGDTFAQIRFQGDGAGTVDGMSFAGEQGIAFWFIQTLSSQGRILRDHSGGFGGTDVEVVAVYDQPDVNGYNSIAACSVNEALAVGDVDDSGDGVVVKVV